MRAAVVSSSQQDARETAAPLISIFSTALVPWASGRVFGEDPGCVYPSTVIGSVAFGSHVARTMVWTPGPGMLNAIVSAPGFALASRIAWRNDPAPESAVVVTVKVAAGADAAADRATARTAESRIVVFSLKEDAAP